MTGQLLDRERAWLKANVVAHKPKLIFESGTWKGGGSTFQIATAILENGFGELYTAEPNCDARAEAAKIYEDDNKWGERIHCVNGTGIELLTCLAKRQIQPDFAFLDGDEDEHETYWELMMLGQMMAEGNIVIFHDWEPKHSVKCNKVREYLKTCKQWHVQEVIAGEDTVGMAKIVKL